MEDHDFNTEGGGGEDGSNTEGGGGEDDSNMKAGGGEDGSGDGIIGTYSHCK